MPSSPIRVERLCAARREDFLRFFDHERGPAFSDNPEWARCYCHYYHVAKVLPWKEFAAGENRTAMTARIDAGEQEGFLAYAGEEVVGWLNAAPWHKLPHACDRMEVLRPPLDVPDHAAAAILCFVIAPASRRRGVARALLDGALASFAARGIRVVDAFPFKAGADPTPADLYHGPAALFAAAGFRTLAETAELTVMRWQLGDPPMAPPAAGLRRL